MVISDSICMSQALLFTTSLAVNVHCWAELSFQTDELSTGPTEEPSTRNSNWFSDTDRPAEHFQLLLFISDVQHLQFWLFAA